MNIIVIGAGIAGSSVVRALRAIGRDVDHIAAPAFAVESRASVAILRRAHVRERGEKRLFDRTLELYRQWGVPVVRGGWVSTSEAPGRPVFDEDWALVHPATPLVPPDRTAIAVPTPTGVRLDDGTELTADRVIWCHGAHSAPFGGGCTAPNRSARYGVTWTHPCPSALTQPDRIRVHRLRAYQHIVAGVTPGNGARLGTSSARTLADARELAETMLGAALEHGIVTTLKDWVPVAGCRVHDPDEPARRAAHMVGPHWRYAGLQHTGYALAPAVAERIAQQVIES